MMDQYDLVIIGAGVYGLAMAKTYLEIHPKAQILILDANKSVGGTWSQQRLYNGLQTNNHVGEVEYPDFPMTGVPKGSHIPGTKMHDYLTTFAQHYGVYKKIKFQALVTSAELRKENDWIVSYDWKDGSAETKHLQVLAEKLVLATGTTSEPNMPSIPGMESFRGDIFHSIELPDRKKEMNASKNVVVLGGSKSAADAVYLNASEGRHVDWVIRKSGAGPSWLSHIAVSPAKISIEKLATTRIMTFLSESFDLDAYPRIRYLLHNTSLGRAIVRGFFGIIKDEMITNGKFNDHPETQKLIPKTSAYYSGTKLGVFNYPTPLFDLVQQGLINIHIADVTSMSPETVDLSNDTSIKADIVICATGYTHRPLGKFTFLPETLTSIPGLFTASPTSPDVQAADAEILRRFPGLASQPEAIDIINEPSLSWHLYRTVIPPAFINSRNLAYIGMAPNLRGFLVSGAQALWITAFFDNKLSVDLPNEEEATWQALLLARFWRWRASMGLGCKGPDMVFEVLPHVDTLLRDLGLETKRKKGWFCWVKELFEWHGVADYGGLVREWLQKEGYSVDRVKKD